MGSVLTKSNGVGGKAGRKLSPENCCNYSVQKLLLSFVILKILSIMVCTALCAGWFRMGSVFCLLLGWKNLNYKCVETKRVGK